MAVEKATYLNFSAVEETKIAGLDVAYVYHAEIPPKKGTEFVSRGVIFWLAGTKDDVFVNGMIRVIDPVGGKNRLLKGSTAKGKGNGKVMEAELQNDATLVKKVFYGTRTLDQDREFVMQLLLSIQQ
ncbi:hypothetical protein ACQQ2Q_19800 [Agrobacterium sp. ES01]|uniref:hypothetical protein n=1 Tax=Agrobacterium sp. ES01 TaxID=3420714 RepID=UPI003D150637